MLTGGDEAIVTEIAGTTRDVLHEKISIGDLMLNLYDTAGIREIGSDVIEGIGIERSKKKMAEAELILAVFDGASEISREEEEFIRLLTESGSQKIIILSKSDIGAATGEKEKRLEAIFGSALHITDKDPIGAVTQLKDKIAELFNNGNIDINTDAIISTARQNADLYRTLDHINCALDAYSSGLSEDAASSDIELALGAIAELEGVSVSESVVSDIFSRFCVGK
jgi:tRNA modification GTPase